MLSERWPSYEQRMVLSSILTNTIYTPSLMRSLSGRLGCAVEMGSSKMFSFAAQLTRRYSVLGRLVEAQCKISILLVGSRRRAARVQPKAGARALIIVQSESSPQR